jgi:hypothetical protein
VIVEYNAMFVAELRAFEGLERKRILGYMRAIERAPFATGPQPGRPAADAQARNDAGELRRYRDPLLRHP